MRKEYEYKDNKWAYFCANLIVLLCASILFGNWAVGIIGIVGVLITIICANGLPQRYYGYMFFVVMIMFLYLMVHYLGLIEEYGIPYYAGDDEHFESWGRYLYEQKIFSFRGLKKVVFTNQGNAKGYPLLLAWIKLLSLGNYHTVMPRILNLYLWLSLSILTLKLLKLRINNLQIETCMFFSLALFPNGLFISSFVYRDTLMEFLIIVIIYNFLMLTSHQRTADIRLRKALYIIVLVLSVFFLSYIRYTAVYICALLAAMIYMDTHREMPRKYKVLLYLFMGIAGLAFLIYYNLPEMLLDYSNKYTSYLLSQQYGLSSKIFSMPILPYGWILRGLYGLVVPFPAGLFSLDFLNKPFFALSNGVVYLGTFYQIIMLPYLVKAVLKRNVNAWMYLAVYASIILTTFTFRHFIMPLPFLALAASEEFAGTSKIKRKNYFVLIIIGILFMALLYLVLKLV